MRLLALGLAVALAFVAHADQDKTARADYNSLRAELAKELRSASPEERRKLSHEYADKFLAHATKHPKDASAVEALIQVVQMIRPGRSETRTKALELLEGDIGKQTAIRRHLRVLTANPLDDEALAVVLALAKSHPDTTTRAWAMQALIKGYDARNQQAKQLESNEEFREQFEKLEGKEAAKKLIEKASNARLRARACGQS